MKKTLLSVIITVLTFSVLMAQSPQSFKYQAVIRDNAGNIIEGQTVNVRITIKEGTSSGSTVYQETFTPTTNSYGLIFLNIGTGSPVIGVFSSIVWRNNDYFIQVEVDAGSGYINMGTTQLLSVPYAFHANTSDSIIGGVTENDPTWTGASDTIGDISRYGRVGLGISTPMTTLHLKSPNWRDHLLIERSDLTVSRMFGLTQTVNSNRAQFYFVDTDGVTNPKTVIEFDEGGSGARLGINTAPAHELDVNGYVRIRGGSPATGKVLTSSDSWGTATWETILSPIALGNISSSGVLNSGTPNIQSVVWNSASSRYEIEITGVNYHFNNFITVVTPTSTTAASIVSTNSVSGKLLVYIRNTSGTLVQSGFHFVVYKP